MAIWGDNSAVYGLKLGGRCIVSLPAPTETSSAPPARENEGPPDKSSDSDSVTSSLADASCHHFLLGTCSLKKDNELHHVVFNEETGDIRCQAVYEHPDEVWHLAPNPEEPSLIATVHNHSGRKKSTLWRFPPNNSEGSDTISSSSPQNLENIAEIPHTTGSSDRGSESLHFAWDSDGRRGLHVARDSVDVVAMQDHGSRPAISSTISLPDFSRAGDSFHKAIWDPHHSNEFATIIAGNIIHHDLRQPKEVKRIMRAHAEMVFNVDYNPNKPYCLASCGDDCLVKFWDLRMAGQGRDQSGSPSGRHHAPLRVLRGHTHWVRAVKYNPFHDQLVLTSGSDAAVGLWRVSSISSAPLLEIDAGEEDEDLGSQGSDGSDNDGDKIQDRMSSHRSSLASSTIESKETSTADDVLIRKSEEHEESVYSVAWSASEAWTYASLSLDGRMVVSHVPSAEKYKILL